MPGASESSLFTQPNDDTFVLSLVTSLYVSWYRVLVLAPNWSRVRFFIIGYAPSVSMSTLRFSGASDHACANFTASATSADLVLTAVVPPTLNGTTSDPSSVGNGNAPKCAACSGVM